jgi:hypothetical protein
MLVTTLVSLLSWNMPWQLPYKETGPFRRRKNGNRTAVRRKGRTATSDPTFHRVVSGGDHRVGHVPQHERTQVVGQLGLKPVDSAVVVDRALFGACVVRPVSPSCFCYSVSWTCSFLGVFLDLSRDRDRDRDFLRVIGLWVLSFFNFTFAYVNLCRYYLGK